MDLNGLPYDGVPMNELPMGYPAAFVGEGALMGMSDSMLLGYDSLTEAEKEELIFRCKGAKTKEEMQKIVEEVAPGVDVQQVYEEEGENFL